MDKKEYNELEAFEKVAKRVQELERQQSELNAELRQREEELVTERQAREDLESKLKSVQARLNPERAPSPARLTAKRFSAASALDRTADEFSELLKSHMESQKPGSWESRYSQDYIRLMKQYHKHYSTLDKQYQRKQIEIMQGHGNSEIAGAAFLAGVAPLFAELGDWAE